MRPLETRHFAVGRRFSPSITISGRTLGVKRKQSPFGNQQIRQAKQREEVCGILGQSAITRLLQREHVLDDVEGMSDLGPDAGLELLDPFAQSLALGVRQHTALARPQGHVPGHVGVPILISLPDALIARIAEDRRLVAVQQGVGLGDVADIGRSGDDGVGQPGFRIDPNVRLHAEVPLVALLGLVHQALGGQMHVDRRKNTLGQLVRFQQAAVLEQGGDIGRRLMGEVDADEAASPDCRIWRLPSPRRTDRSIMAGPSHPQTLPILRQQSNLQSACRQVAVVLSRRLASLTASAHPVRLNEAAARCLYRANCIVAPVFRFASLKSP